MEIDLTNAKPCPDCRQCLTTDPKCHRCSEKDALIAERDRNHRERVMLLGKWGECKIDCENLIAERDRLRAEVARLSGYSEGLIRDHSDLARQLAAANDTMAGLREALQPFAEFGRYTVEKPRLGLSEMLYNWDGYEGPSIMKAHLKNAADALARTPDEHRDRIVAAGLREGAAMIESRWDYWYPDKAIADDLREMADRLERGE